MTEAQAKAKGYEVKIGKFPFLANSKATILGQHDGFVKVVSDAQYGEILGVHIIGPIAYEIIGEAVLAMEAEATVETVMHTIHAHPTVYEAVGEAFNAVNGLAINVCSVAAARGSSKSATSAACATRPPSSSSASWWNTANPARSRISFCSSSMRPW